MISSILTLCHDLFHPHINVRVQMRSREVKELARDHTARVGAGVKLGLHNSWSVPPPSSTTPQVPQGPREQEPGRRETTGHLIGSRCQRGPARPATVAEISQRMCGEVLCAPRAGVFQHPSWEPQASPVHFAEGTFCFRCTGRKAGTARVGVS